MRGGCDDYAGMGCETVSDKQYGVTQGAVRSPGLALNFGNYGDRRIYYAANSSYFMGMTFQ